METLNVSEKIKMMERESCSWNNRELRLCVRSQNQGNWVIFIPVTK